MSKQVMQNALDALVFAESQLGRLWVSHHANRTDLALMRAQDLYWESELGDMDGKTVEPLYLDPPDTEAMRKELERVTLCLKKANDSTEKFERKWYLLGDELERVKGERDALLIACKRALNYAKNVGKAEGVLLTVMVIYRLLRRPLQRKGW